MVNVGLFRSKSCMITTRQQHHHHTTSVSSSRLLTKVLHDPDEVACSAASVAILL